MKRTPPPPPSHLIFEKNQSMELLYPSSHDQVQLLTFDSQIIHDHQLENVQEEEVPSVSNNSNETVIPEYVAEHNSISRNKFANQFPDPMAHQSIVRRFLAGASYPLYAIKYFCSHFFLWYAIIPALLVTVSLVSSVIGGIMLGNGIIRAIWHPVPVREFFFDPSKK